MIRTSADKYWKYQCIMLAIERQKCSSMVPTFGVSFGKVSGVYIAYNNLNLETQKCAF